MIVCSKLADSLLNEMENKSVGQRSLRVTQRLRRSRSWLLVVKEGSTKVSKLEAVTSTVLYDLIGDDRWRSREGLC